MGPGAPARVVSLSRQTEAVISKHSVMLVHGDRVWRLSKSEAKKLAQTVGDHAATGRPEGRHE